MMFMVSASGDSMNVNIDLQEKQVSGDLAYFILLSTDKKQFSYFYFKKKCLKQQSRPTSPYRCSPNEEIF